MNLKVFFFKKKLIGLLNVQSGPHDLNLAQADIEYSVPIGLSEGVKSTGARADGREKNINP